MTAPSLTQTAINAIWKRPGIRSDALAKQLEALPINLFAALRAPVTAGLIVRCKVERPGKPDAIEYRPGQMAPEKAPDWEKWRVTAAPVAGPATDEAKPYQPAAVARRETNVCTQAGRGANNPGSRGSENPVGEPPPSPEAATVVETPAPAAPLHGEAPAVSNETGPQWRSIWDGDGGAPTLHAMMSIEGTLFVNYGGIPLVLPRDAAAELLAFLKHTRALLA